MHYTTLYYTTVSASVLHCLLSIGVHVIFWSGIVGRFASTCVNLHVLDLRKASYTQMEVSALCFLITTLWSSKFIELDVSRRLIIANLVTFVETLHGCRGLSHRCIMHGKNPARPAVSFIFICFTTWVLPYHPTCPTLPEWLNFVCSTTRGPQIQKNPVRDFKSLQDFKDFCGKISRFQS